MVADGRRAAERSRPAAETALDLRPLAIGLIVSTLYRGAYDDVRPGLVAWKNNHTVDPRL